MGVDANGCRDASGGRTYTFATVQRTKRECKEDESSGVLQVIAYNYTQF